MWTAGGDALRVELAAAREVPSLLGAALPGYSCCGGYHCQAAREALVLLWREDGPPNHLDDRVDSDQ